MALDKAAIFAAPKFNIRQVQVPEWNGSVFVRTMTGSERDRFEAEHMQREHEDFRARIVAATCCDEDGNLLFSLTDVVEIGKLGFRALDRIVEAAVSINLLNAQEVDNLEKKSEPTPGVCESSDLRAITA